MAAIANISFYKGEDVTLVVTLDPPTDITAWTGITFSFARRLGEAPLFTKTLLDGVSKADTANGVIHVDIASGDTIDLEGGEDEAGSEVVTLYVYSVRRSDTGHRTVLTLGNVTLAPEVAP